MENKQVSSIACCFKFMQQPDKTSVHFPGTAFLYKRLPAAEILPLSELKVVFCTA